MFVVPSRLLSSGVESGVLAFHSVGVAQLLSVLALWPLVYALVGFVFTDAVVAGMVT
jgi:hypothetical protein